MTITSTEIQELSDGEYLQVGIFAITRESAIMNVLGIPTKMYTVDKYQILDPFNTIVFDGSAEDVAGFATGLMDDSE